MLPQHMLLIREYVDARGRSPFAEWFEDLDPRAAAKVTVALARIEMGNLSNVKGAGGGVLEYLVILLAGGTKKRQQRAIAAAQERWADYRRRRKEER